jgi:hypothetical protein
LEKLSQFYDKNKKTVGVSYLTFKKYIFENIENYKDCIKIVDNTKRKSYFVTDEENFLRIFKA